MNIIPIVINMNTIMSAMRKAFLGTYGRNEGECRLSAYVLLSGIADQG